MLLYRRMLQRLAILCLSLLLSINALDIFVSNNYNSTTCTTATAQCPDISSALNISESYGNIFVRPGVYSGTGNANLCIGACVGLEGLTISGLGPPSQVLLLSSGTPFADSIALYIYENTVTAISNITFQGFINPVSTEPNKVGAIEIVRSDVRFEHVIFQNNSGILGGAIHATNSNATFNSTHFLSNTAKLHGGAIMLVNSDAVFNGCTFIRNNVSTEPANLAGTGGAVYFVGVNDLTILDSEFIDNEAEISGGAVFMDLNSNSGLKKLRGQFIARNCLFKGNTVNGLGSCVAAGNCNSRGGAIFLSTLSANMEQCRFERNVVTTTSSSKAAQGGALYFTTNALDILSPYVGSYLYNCSFNGNHATGQGGAMHVTGQRLDLLSSVFTDNYVNTVNTYFTDAPSQGGAVYYSSGSLGAVTSNVLDCEFTGNSAFSGWGGAFFGTDTVGTVYFQRTTFTNNIALSSYTNTGHGGAVMVASGFNMNMYDCSFTNNSALPYLHLVPLTYSGAGGAIFAQTTAINITKCDFRYNLALTGQFDSGSAGGALMMEDCFPATLAHSTFEYNGASGYYGYSAFASPGTGGAIYVKFSAAKMFHNSFRKNWVSAGGNEASIGGAVAVFFEYSSVSKSTEGVSIQHCDFQENAAYGELCSVPNQSGQGGALAVVGASKPAVYISHVNFTNNMALTASKKSSSYLKEENLSLGGALSIALSTNITINKSTFRTNFAYNGAGNDLSSISGQTDQENFVHSTDSTFIGGDKVSQSLLVQGAAQQAAQICSTIKAFQDQANNLAVTAAHKLALASRHREPVAFSEPEDHTSQQSPFNIPSEWHAHLVEDSQADGEEGRLGGSVATLTKSMRNQFRSSITQAQQHYLKNRNTSLLREKTSREHVQSVVNEILRLDLWKQQSSAVAHSHEILVDEVPPPALEVTQRNVLGRRVRPTTSASRTSSLQQLEDKYRRNLFAQIDAEFARLTGSPQPLSTTSGTITPDSPASVLLNFHPYVVITSGKAYFENPTFRGVYHMFFGDFPEIAQYAYNDNYILSSIVAVPSYSAIFGHITQDDLTLTAITASIEIFDSNDNQNYSISQVNLFNATLQLNRNVTVTGGSFVTGSLITSVSDDSSSLIPYIAGGDSHPFVTFGSTLYTGVSLQSIVSALGSALDRNNNLYSNTTEQTLVTINSCTVVVDGMMISDAPTDSHATINFIDIPAGLDTNARILLTNDAMIHISDSGTLALLAETFIDAETTVTPAVRNLGRVELLGRTKVANYSHSGKLDTAPFSRAASLGSLASRLVVHGDFIQEQSGSTRLYMNHTHQTAPSMYLINSANFSGSVFVDFYTNPDDNLYPDLELYGGVTPSAYTLIGFKNRFSAASMLAFEELAVHPQSPGLDFSQSTQVMSTVIPSVASTPARAVSGGNVTDVFAWSIQVENIACPQINQYYDGVPQQDKLQASSPNAYSCYVCLQNTSCNLCNGVNGAAGMCALAGGCGSAGVAFGDSCCEGGCNGEYGTCTVNAEHTTFSCDCSKTIWYTGAHCAELSAEAYVIIFTCISFVITLLVMGFFYHRSLQQKRIVLDELADGLLNHQTQGVNSEYIQYMQQALILNDVFVKWEEITLESVVGEGSFGVVHKATFRGAQVAVKQMRSMFTELTDKEIDEFRKEAYVMSRLRHPNIVLVMGISLVDQEPVAPPKTRSQNISADGYDSMYPGLADGKKAKPQKTVCIITEFLEQGSLADILYGPTKLPAEIWTYELVLTCALQAARGMLYLHSHQPPICHRDLKSSNLVVDDHWVVKVTDFGMSRIVPENIQDRDKGIVSPASSTTTASHPLGPRKFSLGNSPAGRKFSLGWPSQTSSSLQSTPANSAVPTAAAAAEVTRKLQQQKADDEADAELPGERASIATVDSMQDSHPEQSTGGLSSANRKSTFGKGNSRLSTLNPEMTSNLGTTAWCAPEVLVSGMKTRYTVKVDVYSFGLVLWELWEKKRPFEELTSRFDIMDAVRAGKRPPISANCPHSYRDLIQRCWQAEPSRRPMFKYIVRFLKDELARVKRQKGGAMFNPNAMRPSESGDVDARRSGSHYSNTAGGTLAEAAEAAADFFRKSFSFTVARSSFQGTQQQATSPPGNHKPWISGTKNQDEGFVYTDSQHSALAALSAAARRNDDGSLRISDGAASNRVSGATRASDGTGGTSSMGTGRASEVAGGSGRASEAVKVPEGRTALVAAVTSERSLSYLTESPAPFSHMVAINRQSQRGPQMGMQTSGPTVPTSATKNMNNRWRDRYVMNFSGWAPAKPDSGLPPSLTSPSTHAPATPGFGGGLPPTRSVTSTPLIPPQQQTQPTADISYNPLNRPSGGGTTLSRNNSTNSNPSSAASSPKPAIDRNLTSASAAEDIFVLDEDEERRL